MTASRAPADPGRTSFETTVERVDDRDVVLAETYFYAESGGQPADRGTLGGQQVVDVQHDGDAVVHTLTEPPAFGADDAVVGQVDEAFRRYCMRAHTASHVLYGAGRRLLGDLGYGGFDIGERKVRVDFTTTTDIDDDVLVELERLTNRAVWESRPVTWETYPADEALAMDRIAFNTRTEEGIAGDDVRVVTVGAAAGEDGPDAEPWDVAACGGTHVRNTREIGPVSVLERSNPGEGLTRVEFAVGPTAIEDRADEKTAAMNAARAAGTSVEGLPAEVDRLQSTVADLQDEVATLRERVVDARIAELREDVVERDGDAWLVGHVEGLDANALGERAKALAGDAGDVVALVGEDGGTFIAVGTDGPDAGAVVDDVTDAFGGGGGGRPQFAQGGGIDADPADVVAYLR
jgi:alanyl-tRNA synthetase